MTTERQQVSTATTVRQQRSKEVEQQANRVKSSSSEHERATTGDEMNLVAATSAKRVVGSSCGDGRLSSGNSSASSSAGGSTADQRVLLVSARNRSDDCTTRIKSQHQQVHGNRNQICRHHKQHLLRRSTCSKHQLVQPKQLVSNNGHHQQTTAKQLHHHQNHCVHHPAHPRHAAVATNQGHDCAATYLRQPADETFCAPTGQSFVVARRERSCRRHHPATGDEDQDNVAGEGRLRRRNQITDSCNNSTRIYLGDESSRDQQQSTNKRTTMKFISQLYFLIHLSAILSLLLHHKNLVTSESWQRVHHQQPPASTHRQPHTSSAQAKRHQEDDTTSVPLHINQLPIPLMLINGAADSTIRSFVPVDSRHRPPPSEYSQAGDARLRRTLPQMLMTPSTMSAGGSGGDILIRLFGYRQARWALHYFLAYLLCSSITMLACLRIFRRRARRHRGACVDCCHPAQTGRPAVEKPERRRSPFATATFGGFYYRTRLDCTPVLVGSISLGFIQLIVIGLDIAAKVDWLSPPTPPTPSGESNDRWPIYLPFLQFVFVSLLMQYILSKVAKNNNQVAEAAAAAATNSAELFAAAANGRHLATSADNNSRHTGESLAATTQRHPKHLEPRQAENNGKRSGLQNIALAHLLVTHILLWLMKLNSISLFQAIEQQQPFLTFSRSRGLPMVDQQAAAGAGRSVTTLAPAQVSSGGEIKREFNRTEKENLLRKPLASLTMVNLNASSTNTQQVATQQPTAVANSSSSDPLGGQYRRSSEAVTSIANSTQQRAPPSSEAGQDNSSSSSSSSSSKQERGLRSASGVSSSHETSKFTLVNATTTTAAPAAAGSPMNNDSVLIPRAQLANLLELATKNVVHQVSPNSAPTTSSPTPVPAPTSSPTSSPTTTTTTTTTTTSTTTQRPLFKSSIPKRMTIFRQIQKPILSWTPMNETMVAMTLPPAPLPPTTTPAATTTTREPRVDVTKKISSPKQRAIKIEVSRDDGQSGDDLLTTPAGALDDDDDYPRTVTVAPTESQAGTTSDFDQDDVERRTTRKATSSTGRPFPSVELPAPIDNNQLIGEQADYVAGEITTTTEPLANNESSGLELGEGSELGAGGEFDLPPVPNYDEPATNTSDSADPEEQPSQVSVSLVNASSPVSERLVLESDLPDQEQDGPQLTLSDYLLPIVYQYHILIIAILFNMWLDSLRFGPSPQQTRALTRHRCRRFVSLSECSHHSPGARRRLVRSRSMESDLANRQSRRDIRRQDWDETSSTNSSSSLAGSIRASSEQLLWLGGQRREAPAPGMRNRDSPASVSPTSSQQQHQHQQQHRLPHRRTIIATYGDEHHSAHSACSVFFGLITVSTALIIILLGVELLTILNQCATQLLSILVCLVGLCLNWRSQTNLKRRAADQLARQYHRQGKRLLLSRKGAAYLTNPHDILLSGKIPAPNQLQQQQSDISTVSREMLSRTTTTTTPLAPGGNHRQCFHYLFLLAAYFCGVSIALNLGKQHTVQQLFPPHIMQFLQRQWLQEAPRASARSDPSSSLFQNWGFFWSSSPLLSGEPLSPMILFHVVLAAKGLLLIVQVTLQTILIRSSCSQRATRQLRQVYTFLMFSNLSLWAMDIFEQQQHLHRHDFGSTTLDSGNQDRLRLITLDGFTQFASSIVTLSHLYHGLVFMQH